ncbi:uncharacterized protein DEA37_0010958, partial [Paragonimus westermani]
METETFEFGPLLVEKTKEKVIEGYYPENRTTLKLVNTSPMEAQINLGLLADANEECFSYEPKNMLLIPGESKEVTLWAFPRTGKRYEDALVCAIKDNPEPVVLKFACDGSLPALELDKKVFNFDKVLLQRKDVRSITLRNPTLLPVLWKLAGVDALGEEFSVPQDAGLVEPKSEFVLYAYFRAMKPFKSGQKKNLRLEVYDVENLAGMIQAETIQVIAEAYDVALDISFPKSSDGGIDFGMVRVGEEVKQLISLKNKGPYEITAKFTIAPSKGINFGALVVQHRKTRQIAIENNGEQDFRFSIVRMSKMIEVVTAKEMGLQKAKQNDMMLLTTPQSKLQVGFFTITPASGTIPTGNAQLITIECFAEIKGVSEEEFAIEISDRDTVSYRYGVPYVLQAEGHLPSIETTDIATIFEEHRICSDLTTLKPIELVDKINLNVVDADHVFYLEPVENSEALLFIDHRILPTKAATELVPKRLSSASEQHSVASQLNTAGLLLQPGKQFCFRVCYRPNQSGLKSLGQIRLLVVNNPYEDTLVELVGESLADEVCLYDLPQLEPERARCIKEALIRCSSASKGAADSNKQDGAESEMSSNLVNHTLPTTILREALRHNHLDFGDCPPSEPVSYTFTFTHCGKLDNMEPTSFRYAWPTDHPNLQFQPSEGHLHPNQSRRITVTFCASNGPVTLQASPIKCVLRRIRLPIPEGCTK